MTQAAEILDFPTPRRSRARIRVALAAPSDYDDVVGLLRASGHHDIAQALDPVRLYPFWVVATVDKTVAACFHLSPGNPMIFVEFMCIDSDLAPRERARLIKRLEGQATATAVTMGASMVCLFIPFEMKQWKKIVKKRGYESEGVGNWMVRRL